MGKKKRRPGPAEMSLPTSARARLKESAALLRRGQVERAEQLLADVARHHPDHDDLLALRLELAARRHDTANVVALASTLAERHPEDARSRLRLARALADHRQLAQALRAFRAFLERWPNHSSAAEARQALERAEASLRPLLAAHGLEGEEGLALFAGHEQALALLERGDAASARQGAERLLAERPGFVPALAVAAEAAFRVGDLAQAVSLARRATELAPASASAQAELVEFLVRAGKLGEAREEAERLKELRPADSDGWLDVAAALSFLGDDAAVRDAAGRARAGLGELSPQRQALLEHLAAVAAYRQGDEDEARRGWERALRAQPGHTDARKNLDDLRLPVGQRHAAWPFGLLAWVSSAVIDQMAALPKPAAGDKKRRIESVRSVVQSRPELVGLVPALLDRGSHQGRSLGLAFAQAQPGPDIDQALIHFGQGRRGPDDLRVGALQMAVERSALPAGRMRLCLNGEWRELLVLGFEVHSEPVYQHAPEVQPLLEEANALLHRHDGVGAENLLRRALELEPDKPDLLNNLAMAFVQQDREDEATSLVQDLHARFPDYLFARVWLARRAGRAGRFDEAEVLLRPLLNRRLLHESELSTLAAAQIEALLLRGERLDAMMWLQAWASGAPDHPDLPRYYQAVRASSSFDG
jgi:predicted Zn-dependent protease